MNKKGQSLSLNTIIIAIMVLMVLIVVVTFFLGGFGRIKNTVANVFFPATAGTDLAIAVQTCEQRCDQARLLPSEKLKGQSAYCKSYFTIDYNGDGEADKDNQGKFIKFYCSSNKETFGTDEDSESQGLDVPCIVKNSESKEVELSSLCK